MTKPGTVDEYIAGFPKEFHELLKSIRSTIKKAAPQAEESISYGIPAYKQNGVLIYFAGFKNHIGIYPAPRENAAFKKELLHYKGGKGTVQFELDKPVPLDLIARIVKFRLKENLEKVSVKKKKV